MRLSKWSQRPSGKENRLCERGIAFTQLADYPVRERKLSVSLIHDRVAQARAGTNPKVICRMPSGWAVMGDVQFLEGYCLLLPDPVVESLNALSDSERKQFLSDMSAVGDALLEATGAARINYEILGNSEPALHAHIFPRYPTEPEDKRRMPVWFYDWNNAPAFREQDHGRLRLRIAEVLASATSDAEDMCIRIFQHGDDAAIARIFSRAIHEIASEAYTSAQCLAWSDKEPNHDHWQRRCEIKRPFVAITDGEISGFLELDPDGHIDCATINPDFQRRGIMTQLVQHAVECCSAFGIDRVHVDAPICARAMFEKCGFKVVEEKQVAIGKVALTNFAMEFVKMNAARTRPNLLK